jgi:hypothetical protein
MWRNILGVAAALVAATLIIMLAEVAANSAFPVPESVDETDYHQYSHYMETVPAGRLQIILGGWIVGSVIAGALIALITRKEDKSPSILTGVLLMCTAIVSVFLYPHPAWFKVCSIFVFVPAAIAGHIAALRLQRAS